MKNTRKDSTKDTIKGAVISALITGVLGIVATILGIIISASMAKEKSEKETINEVNSQIANITGDNNTVMINSVDDLITRYDELISENMSLYAQNTEYFNELEEVKKELDSLKEQSDFEVQELEQQIDEIPDIQYRNAGLAIDGISISVNANKSIITVEGRDYISKEIFEKIMSSDESLTVKDDMLYIGKVIEDQANLFEQIEFDKSAIYLKTYKDSFGSEYPNSYLLSNDSFVTYNLDRKYAMLDLSMVLGENAANSYEGYILVEADGKNVYTSPSIKKTTEPFRAQISINNCKLLTIRYEQDYSYASYACIISDAIVYN